MNRFDWFLVTVLTCAAIAMASCAHKSAKDDLHDKYQSYLDSFDKPATQGQLENVFLELRKIIVHRVGRMPEQNQDSGQLRQALTPEQIETDKAILRKYGIEPDAK